MHENDNENMFITMDIYKYQRNKMQDINTSEKASNSKFTFIIAMVKRAWSRSLMPQFLLYNRKTFHFEGAENMKRCIAGGGGGGGGGVKSFYYTRECGIILQAMVWTYTKCIT